MKIKTADLIGPALDWAVAQGEGETQAVQFSPLASSKHYFAPSRKWSQGGPIIDREKIGFWCDDRTGVWGANKQGIPYQQFGPTLLIATMRCYVAYKFGDEIEIPDELV